jgi:hypothetical protein
MGDAEQPLVSVVDEILGKQDHQSETRSREPQGGHACARHGGLGVTAGTSVPALREAS